MENFPSSFMAKKVISKVNYYRLKKIEDDMKSIRKKIVKSFHGNVHYHSEITHDMLPDLTEEEQKNFYCMIKDELQQRGFVVRGKILGNKLTLIVFSNTPRNIEMDRVLKQYSEDMSDASSDHSSTHSLERNLSIDLQKNASTINHSSSVPNSPVASTKKLKPSGPSRQISGSARPVSASTSSRTASRTVSRSVSRSNSRSSSNSVSRKSFSKSERKVSKIPRVKPRSSSFTKSTSDKHSDLKTASKKSQINHPLSSETIQHPPVNVLSQSVDSPVLMDQSSDSPTIVLSEIQPKSEIPNTSENDGTPQKLNMDFIMEKLKKANRKQNTTKRS